jgi:hypothetical protein
VDTVQPPPLLPTIAQEAERFGDDLTRWLTNVPASQRGAALAHVLAQTFNGIQAMEAKEPEPDNVPQHLFEGFQDNFPGKQHIPQALKDWLLKHINLEQVEAELREVRETGGFSFDQFFPELEKLAQAHE